MLINYETATDKELEQALSKLTITEENGEYKNLAHNGLWIGGDSPSYCSDWNATMPLAVEHGISALDCDGTYEVSYDYEAPVGAFGTDEMVSWHIEVDKSQVLRAIVICLIKVLEAKNDAGQK